MVIASSVKPVRFRSTTHRSSRALVGFLFACTLAVVGLSDVGAAAPTSLSPPRDLTVRVLNDHVVLRWLPPAHPRQQVKSYSVDSWPSGLSCITTALSCSIAIGGSTTSWRFSVVAHSATSTSAASARTKALNVVNLVIVAGQSNAVGAEAFVKLADPRDPIFQNPDPYATADATPLYVDEGWDVTPGAVLPPHQPLRVSTPQMIGSSGSAQQIIGPEVGAARTLIAQGLSNLVMLKVAWGDSSLGSSGGWAPPVGVFYRKLVNDVGLVERTYGQRSTVVNIGGLIWFQGENDAMDKTLASSYAGNLESFVTSLRADLKSTSLPVVLIKVNLDSLVSFEQAFGPCQTCDAWIAGADQVDAADDAVAATTPMVAAVDSAPFQRGGSLFLHLTAEGELGAGMESASALVSISRAP